METEIYPNVRMRRVRQFEKLRKMSEMALPGPEKFIWPVFIVEGSNIRKPIEALPGQFYYSVDRVCEDVKNVVEQGIGGILVFAVISEDNRSEKGEYAWDDNCLVQQAIREIRKNFLDLAIFGDIGLTGYTDIGHAQILGKDGKFDNDQSLELLKKIASSHARAGVTGVAPSGMIDGQVKELRKCLDENGFKDVVILSYSTKFNSNCYRTFPFDTSAAKRAGLDRGDYLASYMDERTAIRESMLDEKEGADILMVKPSLLYLDIISKIKQKTNIPLAAYNVSGEYSMLSGMIEKGFAELNGLVKESLVAIHRAGADIIISYWANKYDKIFYS